MSRRGSADPANGRERRRSNDDLSCYDSPPRAEAPGNELELLRFENQDLQAALRMEQANNEELRRKVAALETENNNLREYMNDRLV